MAKCPTIVLNVAFFVMGGKKDGERPAAACAGEGRSRARGAAPIAVSMVHSAIATSEISQLGRGRFSSGWDHSQLN